MDVAEGHVRTPLPRGHYRVLATKGIEYSVDSRDVVVQSGKTTSLTLAPRHVVRTPGLVGCDLHVHARPSFDSKVSPEDRVLSLVAAGVDFAVPSEHNIVGDYGPALEGRALSEPLAAPEPAACRPERRAGTGARGGNGSAGPRWRSIPG